MTQVIPNNFLYGGVGVQAETKNVIQIRPADRIQDTEFLGANYSTEPTVPADRQEFAKSLGILAVQHIVQDMQDRIMVLGLLVQGHGLFDKFRVELRRYSTGFTERAIDLRLMGASGHNGDVFAKVLFVEPDHAGGLA